MYRTLLPATRVTAVYNVIFFAILPESTAPQADLKPALSCAASTLLAVLPTARNGAFSIIATMIP